MSNIETSKKIENNDTNDTNEFNEIDFKNQDVEKIIKDALKEMKKTA